MADAAQVPPAPLTTQCSTCKTEKPYKEFNKTQLQRRLTKKSNANGNIGHCKDCVRKMNMKRNYNMTDEEFDKMLEQQQNKCAIEWCNTKLDKTNAHIDHNHYNKKIRGILCVSCNTSLGGLGDSVEKVLVAACYLTNTTDSLSVPMDASVKKSLHHLTSWYAKMSEKESKQTTSTSSSSSSSSSPTTTSTSTTTNKN